jgi:hypothetical protein
MAAKKHIPVKLIIPDSSPVMTLARIGRLDLLSLFTVPIHMVDQVHYELTKPVNDRDGRIALALTGLGPKLIIVETNVGAGFKARQAKDPKTRSRNLGEVAVDEYATMLAHTKGPSFIPLVLFEDPDVLELRIAQLKGVHMLNTTAWLLTLHKAGALPEAKDLISRINELRKSPLDGFEKPARTKKLRSFLPVKETDDEPPGP